MRRNICNVPVRPATQVNIAIARLIWRERESRCASWGKCCRSKRHSEGNRRSGGVNNVLLTKSRWVSSLMLRCDRGVISTVHTFAADIAHTARRRYPLSPFINEICLTHHLVLYPVIWCYPHTLTGSFGELLLDAPARLIRSVYRPDTGTAHGNRSRGYRLRALVQAV